MEGGTRGDGATPACEDPSALRRTTGRKDRATCGAGRQTKATNRERHHISVEELKRRIAQSSAPKVPVAFEFTGALRDALRSKGVEAISNDLRPTTRDGPHVVADVREVVPLQRWRAIFFVGPDCYQHLRADVECLPNKIADCRAFWGGAMVLCFAASGRIWCW